jgi:uncharacterized protein (DUF1330 family)
MPAYVLAQVKVKNPEKMAAYSQAAGPTVAAFGGELTLRAPVTEVLAGESDVERVVMIKFPDADAARGWYTSEAYQALIPLRTEGADAVFILTEMPD